MESSRRDLFNDMAEHRSIKKEKKRRNTYYTHFIFTQKIVKNKRYFIFLQNR